MRPRAAGRWAAGGASTRTPAPVLIVVDLDRAKVAVTEPFLTVAGQTAPPPGITLVRGGLVVATHDVVIRHIRVRPGGAGIARMAGWEVDALTTQAGAWNVIVDHCSFTWATDENLSASGARFQGANPDEWRRNVSHAITFSDNLIAEGLRNAGHSKGEHSKGSLIQIGRASCRERVSSPV